MENIATLHAVETKSQISAREQDARIGVAACYRLLSVYGLTDLTDGFVSARISDSEDEFIVGGYGLLPELARASDLYKRSLKAEPKLEKFSGVDIDAYNFTKSALNTRPEYNACIHAHTEYGVPFSALDCELEPITQYGIMFHGKIGYLDYNDSEVTKGNACDRISALFEGGAEIIILRNHGFLIPGRTISQAFFHLYRIEQACRYQLRIMQSGANSITPKAVDLNTVRDQYWTMTHVDNNGDREWPMLMRKLDRLDPSYKD
ncbi:MAG: class II aldolase/adducin family protein [Pseudomonadota bacterium]